MVTKQIRRILAKYLAKGHITSADVEIEYDQRGYASEKLRRWKSKGVIEIHTVNSWVFTIPKDEIIEIISGGKSNEKL